MGTTDNQDLFIGDHRIKPGSRQQLELKVAKLYDYTEMTLPVEVIRGHKPGPVLFVSAALHGDEINGVEAIRRLLGSKHVHHLQGTLIAVPIVNVFGYNNLSRYLPDRRDLNRSFPGNPKGSMAARLAYIFMEQIVKQSTHGIDLHTGAIHRSNLPQIRACLEIPETARLAEAFGSPVILDTKVPEGSLREAVEKLGIPMLLFEGGEALRHDEDAIKAAYRGVLAVMHEIGMLDSPIHHTPHKEAFIAHTSRWVRAPHGGSLRPKKHMGAKVSKGEVLGEISDPFGKHRVKVKSPVEGIIIGMTKLPLVNHGDGIFHVASFEDTDLVEEYVELYQESLVD